VTTCRQRLAAPERIAHKLTPDENSPRAQNGLSSGQLPSVVHGQISGS
jgi:hypothetical protein